jgi:hypothetical protein
MDEPIPEPKLGTIEVLNVAVDTLTEALALVRQLYPAAVIEENQCTEYYNAGNLNELRGFPHHFSIWGYKSERDRRAFEDYVDAWVNGRDRPVYYRPDNLHCIVMRRVLGSGVHYAVQKKWIE